MRELSFRGAAVNVCRTRITNGARITPSVNPAGPTRQTGSRTTPTASAPGCKLVL